MLLHNVTVRALSQYFLLSLLGHTILSSSIDIANSKFFTRGGGGHSGTKSLPTAKRPRGAEAVNAKI